MSEPLRVLSLFAGIGGFDLGLERTSGFKTVGFVEIDPFCRRVLAKHWPGVPCHDDVTTREFIEGEADVIVGGFPCQDISLAGAGAGLAGTRSGLWRELLRAIRVVRPRVALLENVAALLNRGLGTVLGDLASIGYDAEWHCIPASAVGAPHRRDRVWIIAYARSEQHEGYRSPISGTLAAELSQDDTDANGKRELQSEGSFCEQRGWIGDIREEVANAVRYNAQGKLSRGINAENREVQGERSLGSRRNGDGWWAVEPELGRVAHGIPDRTHRLKSLGNAVVPQIPELIGHSILEAMQ